MGLYSGPLDGIIGPLTLAALGEAIPDSGNQSEDWWGAIKYFRRDEHGIACPCCGLNNATRALMQAADTIREKLGSPMLPSSTSRCQKHNAELPNSAINSKHLSGEAMDFTSPGRSVSALLEAARSTPGVVYAYSIQQNGRDTGYIHFNL